MKKQAFYWLFSQRHNIDQSLKKKLLIGLGVVSAFIVVSGILVTYLGYKATTYFISKAPTQEQIALLATDFKNQSQRVLDQSIQKDCLSVVQAHFNLNVWISKPIAESTTKISAACFGKQK